jgi:catechol 2,3-dioxygenase-like lactoylglutathione lyase family enzyme
MGQQIALVTVVVSDYDEAIAFYVGKLGFVLRDGHAARRRASVGSWWRPGGQQGPGAAPGQGGWPEQGRAVGDQTGGRVFLFLHTDNFARDHAGYQAAGVRFLEEPRSEPYGTVGRFRGTCTAIAGTCWSRRRELGRLGGPLRRRRTLSGATSRSRPEPQRPQWSLKKILGPLVRCVDSGPGPGSCSWMRIVAPDRSPIMKRSRPRHAAMLVSSTAAASSFTIFVYERPADLALRSDTTSAGQAYWADYARFAEALQGAGESGAARPAAAAAGVGSSDRAGPIARRGWRPGARWVAPRRLLHHRGSRSGRCGRARRPRSVGAARRGGRGARTYPAPAMSAR